ncbi:hypothetical protein QYB42_002790 [Clostridium perfringens]|nr:hypothetical protein [Clostridium perfringens]MDU3583787.1 hypothetical protein [Clostridium butyricum]
MLNVFNWINNKDYINKLEGIKCAAFSVDFCIANNCVDRDTYRVINYIVKTLKNIWKDLNLDLFLKINRYGGLESEQEDIRICIFKDKIGINILADSSKDGYETVINTILEEIKKQNKRRELIWEYLKF